MPTEKPSTGISKKWGMLLAASFLSFLLFLGRTPLFDWDEVNFAESAREMLVTGDYLVVRIDYAPFWEKPPLFIWMQAASMKMFGMNAFAARLPNALMGLCTLWALFTLARHIRGPRFGFLVAGLYVASFLPHLYFKSGIIDPGFNLFIFIGIAFLMLFEGMDKEAQRTCRFPLYAGLFTGLATLTKGPVALLVTALVYFIYKGVYDRFRISFSGLVKYLAVYLLVVGLWFGSLILFTPEGLDTVKQFFAYQVELFSKPVAGHEQPFYYHFVIFLIGCFPLAAFAFRGMSLRPADEASLRLKRFSLIWFWVVLLLFSIVRTKIVHYSSLVYFPAVFLAALWLQEMMEGRRRFMPDQWVIYILGALVFSASAVVLPILAAHPQWLLPYVKDEFARANLMLQVPWGGWEWIVGLSILASSVAGAVFLIRKKWNLFLPVLAIGMAVYLNLMCAILGPKIAAYSQGAATDYFASLAGKDVYLMVEGYKSYAHLWYGQSKPFPHSQAEVNNKGLWLANGPVDKPVHLVTKANRLSQNFYNWFPEFKKVGEKGGFVFFRREIPR